jgi:hypothetical protein
VKSTITGINQVELKQMKKSKRTRQKPAGTLGDLVQPYTTWLHGRATRGEITATTLKNSLALLDSIRRTWVDFGSFPVADLEDKMPPAGLEAYRLKYTASRTKQALAALRQMVALGRGSSAPGK